MATMGKSMKMAGRLAAATALSGSLAACDGRFGGTAEEMFAPISMGDPADAARRSPAPAAPGNPVYSGGSRIDNERQFQQAYGDPLAGTGQAIAPRQSYANSVYQDESITTARINGFPASPLIGKPVDYTSQSIAVDQVTYSAPQLPVARPAAPLVQQPMPMAKPAFPVIGGDPMPLPQSIATQSIAPQSSALPTTIFSDASAVVGSSDIVPLQSVPYGSTASHRYMAPEETMSSVGIPMAQLPVYSSEPVLQSVPQQQYSMPVEMIQTEIAETRFTVAEPIATVEMIETVEVAALGGTFAPMPRARPSTLGVSPLVETVAKAAPTVAAAQPNNPLSTPLPSRRPVQYASVSGQAITDAPPLTAPPKMIEVEAVFLDELPTETQAEIAEIATDEIASDSIDMSALEDVQVETAALGSIDTLAPLEIEVELPEPVMTEEEAMAEVIETVEIAETVVTEPADLSTQMASIDTSKLSAPIVEDQPTVEIADDLGDLKELSGTSWRLEMLNGKDVPATAELHFDGSSGFAGGQGICNNYGGEFSETLQGSFDMGNIFSTETKCEHFGLEREYIVALEGASGYRTTPGQGELQLLDARGRVVATFAAF